jgi:sugar lactone lactonase YvrE
MKQVYLKYALATTAFVALVSFTQDSKPEKISFQSDNLFPEGITYDTKKDLIYVSSLKQGKISSVDKQGVCKTVCEDERLISTVGLKYSSKNNKIYVLNADIGASAKSTAASKFNLAQLAIIDVASAKLETLVDLSGLVAGKHFPNDLTLDNEDNVYITDSYAHVVYKVDKNQKASIFSQSALFKPDSATLGLNGIAYSKEGYLLVAKSVAGSLLKVSIKDPSLVEKVNLPEPMFWVDGIYFITEKELVIVRNRFTKTVFLKSDNHWGSATIVSEKINSDLTPTTVTVNKDKVYVINSRLSEMKKEGGNNNYVIDVFSAK